MKRLQVDFVDVYMAHAVSPQRYDEVREHHLPVLRKLRLAGKIRWSGISETFPHDTEHIMLKRAAEDGDFDVMMVGYNILNQSASATVVPLAQRNRIATICMFAVRRALISEFHLREYCQTLKPHFESSAIDLDAVFRVLYEEIGPTLLAEVAYRFARDSSGMDIVLSGTSDLEHLKQNVATMALPPLPHRVTEVLQKVFGCTKGLSGQ